jgi:hypothetical protein
MHLACATLPADLTDSRRLADLAGERVRLAGLVAAEKEAGGGSDREATRHLTLEDEWGLVEVVAPGAGGEAAGPLLLAEGRVELRYGAPVVVAERVERPLPGVSARAASRPAAAAKAAANGQS